MIGLFCFLYYRIIHVGLSKIYQLGTPNICMYIQACATSMYVKNEGALCFVFFYAQRNKRDQQR